MKSQKRSLFIVPHPDDLEISCGIAVQKMVQQGYEIKVVIVCSGELAGDPALREEEATMSSNHLGVQNITFLRYAQFKMPENRWNIKEDLEHITKEFKPNLTFTPWREDTHEDHVVISELSLVACRSVKNVYYFPTPTSLNFVPDTAVLGTKEMLDKKVEALRFHKTQAGSGRISPEAAISSSDYWLQTFGHHSKFAEDRTNKDGASVEVFKLFKQELLS